MGSCLLVPTVVLLNVVSSASGARTDAYHESVIPLHDLAFSFFRLLDLSSEHSDIISESAHITLSLFPPQHCPFQGGIVQIPLQLLSLKGQRIEDSYLVIDRAIAVVSSVGAAVGAVCQYVWCCVFLGLDGSLLIDAVRRGYKEWFS